MIYVGVLTISKDFLISAIDEIRELLFDSSFNAVFHDILIKEHFSVLVLSVKRALYIAVLSFPAID